MTYADQSKREITITTSETFTVARVNREIAGIAWHVGDHTMYVTDGRLQHKRHYYQYLDI
jgi:hypothetical protein